MLPRVSWRHRARSVTRGAGSSLSVGSGWSPEDELRPAAGPRFVLVDGASEGRLTRPSDDRDPAGVAVRTLPRVGYMDGEAGA